MSRVAIVGVLLLAVQLAVAAEITSKDAEAAKQIADKAGQGNFFSAFIASISIIIVSEIGDKTFFIAAIMAMRHNRMVVFMGALFALIVMTILSAVMGLTLPNLISRSYTHLAAALLFFFFGVKLLKEVYENEGDGASEELEEVEHELEKKDSSRLADQLESGGTVAVTTSAPLLSRCRMALRRMLSPVFLQACSMTFLAEWGDRSQISTIALAAAKDPVGVTLGGILGHAICTGMAVIGGRILSTKISPRAVNGVGGVLFLVFAIHELFFNTD
eukprot:TRINITY_DN703_c0_g1_i1.p1 TRINITY_DN703_c0_g1~~TRINITY_DN703_c0_g1_i1.p1  ORF type:complete len:274 (+),score=114.19 TRINITY_DN703_c0_g1_i1:76-897(+)